MFKPVFKGPIEGYAVNFVNRNLWRVEPEHTRADMMQEAYVVFLKLEARYGADMDTPQHFMRLFTRSLGNRMNDISNRVTLDRNAVSAGDDLAAHGGYVGDLDNDGSLLTIIRQAPSEVKAVLNLFLNAPQEVLRVALADWEGLNRHRKDGGGQRINQILGFPRDADVMKKVYKYLGGNI